MSHTPGPWIAKIYGGGETISINGPKDDSHKPVVHWLGFDDVPADDKQNIANARLIAAAPDLLDALELVMSWIDAWDPNFADDDEWFAEDEPKIRAAIAKAKEYLDGHG